MDRTNRSRLGHIGSLGSKRITRFQIVYTSGTSSRPKGVLFTHRSTFNLVADFATGGSGSGVQDTTSLTAALNYVSQQRVTIDNSVTRLNDASSAATEESTQLTQAQTNLMQADVASVSTQLSLTQSQQSALIEIIASLGQESLFDKLQA